MKIDNDRLGPEWYAKCGEVWKKSLIEQAEGRLGPFKELWEVPLDQILLVPRFGVWELRAKGWRVRVIDDFKHNEANAAARFFETATVDTADDVTVGIRALEAALRSAGTGGRGSEPRTAVGLDDFVSAFKTIAPAEDQR